MKLPYIIAEVGLHHDGDIDKALGLVYAAAKAGANAVKFQAVNPETLVSKGAPTYFHQEGQPAQTQREFFSRVKPLTREDYGLLSVYCHRLGVDFLCTPFDVETVAWLDPLVPAFKVASADITNIPLLEAVARTGKPVYLSTGAATIGEVVVAARTVFAGLAKGRGNTKGLWDAVTLLHCVLSYPTPLHDAQLGMIDQMHDQRGSKRGLCFNNVGYSDHTLFNLDVLTTAWLLGASVIEKHFTLDKTLPGNDHYHSMDPQDLRALVTKLKELQAMIGDGEKRVLPCEEAARLNARQSWHAARDLAAGHVIVPGDVVLKRPGDGLAASENPIGMALREAVTADCPILPRAHLGAELPRAFHVA